MKKLILLVVALFLIGCSEQPIMVNKEYVGIIKDASVVPTSWNEPVKMQIKTDKRFFILYTLVDVGIGDSAFIHTYSNGCRYLGWETSSKCYSICRCR